MKEYATEQYPRIVTKKVTCDECGADCTATNVEILFKFSFSQDLTTHMKDICYDCWEQKYKKTYKELKDKELDFIMEEARKQIE